MPIEILMPALSPTMTEGNLAKWLVKEGDDVKSGQVIAEIETDKATMEVEAVDEGTMGKILVSAGTEGVKVNAAIALLLEEGEDKKALEGYKAQGSGVSDQDSGKKGAEKEQPPAAEKPAVSPQKVVSSPTPESRPLTSGSRVFASPLARRIAANEGVPIGQVPGTGPHGRVIKADIEAFIESGGGGRGFVRRNPVDFVKQPNGNIRKVIAKRLTEAKQTVPHFYLTIECQLDRLLDIRQQLNDAAALKARKVSKEEKPAYKLSVNDLIIKASALAMRDVPAANASWTDEAILIYNNIDVSVAVAIDGGLITPIIANADQKDVIAISSEMKDLAKRARENKLKPEEFQGGTFSLSNLGMFGIKHFAAIINPPQGCILAIGAGAERVVVEGGQMVIRQVMEATLSVDHRVVDGAIGAEYLAAFKRYVENPALLLV